MNQPLRMRHRERAGQFLEDARLLREGELLAELVEGKPADQFHDDGRRLRVIEHGVNGDDGRVAHGGRAARFIQDAGSPLGLGLGPQHLERDGAL